MADALASGASGSNTVWVQVPSLALVKEETQEDSLSLFLFQKQERDLEQGSKVFVLLRSAQCSHPLDGLHPIFYMSVRHSTFVL